MCYQRTRVYYCYTYKNVEMLRLKNNECYCCCVNGYEHLKNHSGAYLIPVAVSQEMNSSDSCTYHYESKSYDVICVETENISNASEFGNRNDMVDWF